MKRLAIFLILLWPYLGVACNVPVFRYALERWRASSYEVIVFHRGPLAPADREIADSLKDASDGGKCLANFSLTVVDLSAPGNEASVKLWSRQSTATLPWMMVRAPISGDGAPPLWAGRFDKEASQRLITSPAREEIARRLLHGDSAVWILVESGRAKADEAAFEMLKTELKQAEESIVLPVPDPGDPKMRAELPLRVSFSVLRLVRGDPAEALFFSVLEHHEPVLVANTSPMAIPIYGRGRVLGALTGNQFTLSIIRDACAFITGACSCQVKEQNPGFDLLMAADWEALLDHRLVKESESPPLMGFSQWMDPPAPSPTTLISPARASPEDQIAGMLKRNLLAVLALGSAAIMIGTLILRPKTGNQP